MLATAAWLVMHRGPRESVDFTGGNAAPGPHHARRCRPTQVRSALDAGGLRGVEMQQMTGAAQDEYLIRAGPGPARTRSRASRPRSSARIPGVKVELRRTEHVGPKVGGELRHKALWAMLWSLGGILLYVGWRYEFKFALGAVVALFHDVFVTLGCLMLHRA